MDEVEAVTAVLWRHLEPTPYEAPGVKAGKILMRGVAQEAIAALDACRQEAHRDNLARLFDENRRAGREAGLREAAAVARDQFVGGPWLAERILALIDAGSPTPPGSD